MIMISKKFGKSFCGDDVMGVGGSDPYKSPWNGTGA